MEDIKTKSKFADQSGETMIVELGGHVDQSNSYQLQKMFEDIITSGCYKIVVDFKDLYYMSSAGWGVFIGEIKRFRENGGDIKLANMNPDIQDVFQMLEFFHILEDYVTVEEAVSMFKISDELDLVVDDPLNPDIGINQEPAVEIQEENDIVVEHSTEKKDESMNTKQLKTSSAEILNFLPKENAPARTAANEFTDELPSLASISDVKLHQLPLVEKIKHIISQNPLIGAWGIRKVLSHEHFGYTKVGCFRLIKVLRDLDLNSKSKRYRYYRSC